MTVFPFAALTSIEVAFRPRDFIILLVIIGFFVLIVVYSRVKEMLDDKEAPDKAKRVGRVTQPSLFPNRSDSGPNRADLRYVLKTYGFTREQSDFFTGICKVRKIQNPSQTLQEPKQFEDFCAQVFAYLQAQPKTNIDAEKQKTILFTIKETVENYRHAKKFITSTRGIKPGQQFTLTSNKEEQYPSSVLANTNDGLSCAVPLDISGNELKLPSGSRVKMFFYSGTGESYRLESKIRGYVSTPTSPRMIIGHTDKITKLPNRNHERKSLDMICLFSPVTAANVVNGKHTEHKFFTSGKTFEGEMLDISAGGCSIRTRSPIGNGEYLQIKCMLDGKNEDSIIAKVVKRQPSEETGKTTMHIQFAKIPRVSMNRVFTFIYNYGEKGK
jgi:c-di-GMP-binding flagellar brake protein YcgR